MEPRDKVPRINGAEKLSKYLKAFVRELIATFRTMDIIIEWGKIPEAWELDFVTRMKNLQKQGVRFDRMLERVLPQLFGEESEVLTAWLGDKASRSPERFVRAVSKMWGESAHSVIISINRLAEDPSLFKKGPVEPPYKSFLDAIKKADEEAAARRASVVDAPQQTSLALYKPELLQPLVRRGERQVPEGSESD